MKQKLLTKLLFLTLLTWGGVINSAWATTYKLTKVTTVSAGNKYVFERKSRVLNNTISSSSLQTTTTYSKSGLSGSETYIWELETATGGFYLKNTSLNSDQYLNNSSGTSVTFGSKSSIWSISFTDDVALISNKSNSNRFLGETTSSSNVYKAYATSNLSSYGHDFTVYQVEEEVSMSPVGTFEDIDDVDDATKGSNFVFNPADYFTPDDGLTEAATFTVTPTSGDIYYSGGKIYVTNYGSQEFTVTAKPAAADEEDYEDVSTTFTVTCPDTRAAVNLTAFNATSTTLIVGNTTATSVTNDQGGWSAAYTYESSNTGVATVNASGVVTAVAKGTARITCSLNVNAEDPGYKAGAITSMYVDITVNNPSHTATFSVNGDPSKSSSGDFEEGDDIVFPSDPSDIDGKVFCGWVATPIPGTTNSTPSFVDSPTMGNGDVTYYAVFATATPGDEENTTKTITTSTTGIPTSYGLSNTFTEYTLEGIKFKVQQMYKNGEKLQWRASGHTNGTGTMYNTDALNKIQSIVITYTTDDSNKNFTVKVGDSENPTSGTSITPTSSGKVYTFDCSSYNKDYFVLTNGTGAGYLASIAITYKITGPTTYSAYCTTISALPVPTITFKDDEDNVITELNASSLNAMIPVSVTCSAGDVTLSLESSDDTVAEYDEGYILTNAEGTATITATFAGNGSYQGTSAELLVTVERGTTTLSFPATPATINIDATATYTATGSPAVSEITYSSSNTSAVTVNGATGEITAVAKGSATITASFAGNDDYKPAETSYTISVVDPNELIYTLTNAQIVSGGPSAASGYGSKSITDGNGKTWNAYAIKNYHSGATSDKHFLQIRVYDNPTAYYIQVPAYGTRITELQMTVSATNVPMGSGGNIATLFFSADNTTSAIGAGVASGTGESTVTIDCSSLNLNTGYITASGAVRIWDVKVTYEYTLPVGSTLWTTHVTADAVDFTGVTAYIVKKIYTETVSVTEVTSAPANTPVVIKGDAAKTYHLQTKYSSLDDVSENLLLASDGTVTGGSGIYALSKINDVVGFYPVDGGVTIPAGKAYLDLGDSEVKGFTFDFEDDDATGINSLTPAISEGEGAIYNLAGQRINKMQKGINIVNGKKVMK